MMRGLGHLGFAAPPRLECFGSGVSTMAAA